MSPRAFAAPVGGGWGHGLRPRRDDTGRHRHRSGADGPRSRETEGGEEDRRPGRGEARPARRLGHGPRHSLESHVYGAESGEGPRPRDLEFAGRNGKSPDKPGGGGPRHAGKKEALARGTGPRTGGGDSSGGRSHPG